MNRRSLVTAAAAALTCPGRSFGQSAWPERPIRIVVPFPPGGSNDTVARILQPRLQQLMGRPIVVENRGGASGSVGAGEVARAAPDGYTWALVNDTLATNDTLMSLPYRALESFSFCSIIGTCPYALVTQPTQPFSTMAQVIAAARAAPNTLGYATTGAGSLAHISAVLLQQRGQFQITHVPYRGGGPALQDTLAGHVPLFMSNIVIILPHLRSGALRAVGVSSLQESRFLPGVPPFSTQGFPGFEANTYWAMVGPVGIPQPIVARFQAILAQVLAEPAIHARMEEQGAEILASTPDQAASFIRSEVAKWGAVIRENGIRGES